jgi:hypothetical protein
MNSYSALRTDDLVWSPLEDINRTTFSLIIQPLNMPRVVWTLKRIIAVCRADYLCGKFGGFNFCAVFHTYTHEYGQVMVTSHIYASHSGFILKVSDLFFCYKKCHCKQCKILLSLSLWKNVYLKTCLVRFNNANLICKIISITSKAKNSTPILNLKQGNEID